MTDVFSSPGLWPVSSPSPQLAPAPCSFWALLPCAGTGARAGAGAQADAALPKQYRPVAGRPLVLHTLAAFAGVERLRSTLVAVAPGDIFFDNHPGTGYFAVACGGPSRADTVRGGLRALAERGAQERDWVLVHDAARCLVSTEQINSLIDACMGDQVGGLLAHKLADTLKTASAGPGGIRVVSTVDRGDKWLAQTPQMFRLGQLAKALEQFGSIATDEASAMEAMGERPKLVPGSALNFKVTFPEDFALAEAVLAQRMHAGTLARFGGMQGQSAADGDIARSTT